MLDLGIYLLSLRAPIAWEIVAGIIGMGMRDHSKYVDAGNKGDLGWVSSESGSEHIAFDDLVNDQSRSVAYINGRVYVT